MSKKAAAEFVNKMEAAANLKGTGPKATGTLLLAAKLAKVAGEVTDAAKNVAYAGTQCPDIGKAAAAGLVAYLGLGEEAPADSSEEDDQEEDQEAPEETDGAE